MSLMQRHHIFINLFIENALKEEIVSSPSNTKLRLINFQAPYKTLN